LKRHCLLPVKKRRDGRTQRSGVRTVVIEHHVFTGFVQMRLEKWWCGCKEIPCWSHRAQTSINTFLRHSFWHALTPDLGQSLASNSDCSKWILWLLLFHFPQQVFQQHDTLCGWINECTETPAITPRLWIYSTSIEVWCWYRQSCFIVLCVTHQPLPRCCTKGHLRVVL